MQQPVNVTDRHAASLPLEVRAFDLRRLTRDFLDDPYPTYRALREHAPVHRLPDGSYFLTRYDDLVAVYRDARTWSSDKTVDFKPNFGDSLLYEHHTTSLVFNDPPIHTRVRKLLAPTFAPRALAALQPRIEALVDRLLDAAEARDTIDLIGDFAAAIPVQLIGDLLGIPQNEREPLRQWSLDILGALEPVLAPEKFEAGVGSVRDFKAYLSGLVARRQREHSGDDAEILSKLVAGNELARDAGEGGERLSELELLHNCIFLLNAGHETTTNLIGNAVDLLLRHPGALADLAAHPACIESAVEEFLRMESSNQLGNRRAAVDTEIGGTPCLPAPMCILARRREPRSRAASDPDRLDIRRTPNRHPPGGGIHTCAGNSLARMEARSRLASWWRGSRRSNPAGAPVRGGRARFRGFMHYPVCRAALKGDTRGTADARYVVLCALRSGADRAGLARRNHRVTDKTPHETPTGVYENVPAYRAKLDAAGVTPADFRTLDDIAKFPSPLSRTCGHHPFGILGAARADRARPRLSGTTGKPTVVGYTADIDTWSDLMARRSAHRAGGHEGACGPWLRPVHWRLRRALRRGTARLHRDPGLWRHVLHAGDPRRISRQRHRSARHRAAGRHFRRRAVTTRCAARSRRLDMHAVDIYGISEVMGPGVANECIETKDGLA